MPIFGNTMFCRECEISKFSTSLKDIGELYRLIYVLLPWLHIIILPSPNENLYPCSSSFLIDTRVQLWTTKPCSFYISWTAHGKFFISTGIEKGVNCTFFSICRCKSGVGQNFEAIFLMYLFSAFKAQNQLWHWKVPIFSQFCKLIISIMARRNPFFWMGSWLPCKKESIVHISVFFLNCLGVGQNFGIKNHWNADSEKSAHANLFYN